MDPMLRRDWEELPHILAQTMAEVERFLAGLAERPAAIYPAEADPLLLPDNGLGAVKALEIFQERYAPFISASPGPRYFGFVTGGTTPAALAGDWLTGAIDQNAIEANTAAAQLEREAIAFLRDLFGLPDRFFGSFVSGATMASFVGLALARQWLARQKNIDAAVAGLAALPPLKILSGAPHATIYKAAAMAGLGRGNVELVPCLPNREAVDITALRARLMAFAGEPCIVVGNAGTVNTVDFDDLAQLAALKKEFNFWLHVDGAFGGFAACAAPYRHLLAGLAEADSITIDAHKWLNVPYDAAMQFTPHQDLQLQVFQASAAYLGEIEARPNFVHLTPESSRRLRALPAWFTLLAYGRNGYADIVTRNCAVARQLAERLAASEAFTLLAPARMNVVCFSLKVEPERLSPALIRQFLARLTADGRIFLTPTVYQGRPAMRIAVSNWRTEAADIDIAWQALQDAAAGLTQEQR
jgi:glutamate/tyrosine decarboxylase-like PLP-dependent enzyme